MPIIAVVGEQNAPTQIMQDYIQSIIDYQTADIDKTNELLQKAYGSKATYPDFRIQQFTSEEDLFNWTSAENYTFTDGLEGVCYGFQMSQDTQGAWNLKLYFNDQQ